MQSGSFSCTVSRIIICLRMMDTVVVRSEVSLYKCNPPYSSGFSQYCRNRLTSFNKSLTWIPKWIWLLLNSLSVPQNPIYFRNDPKKKLSQLRHILCNELSRSVAPSPVQAPAPSRPHPMSPCRTGSRLRSTLSRDWWRSKFWAANSGLSRNNPLHWQMSRMWHDTIPGCSVSLPPPYFPNEGPGRSGFGLIHWPLLNIFPNGWQCTPATERETHLISFHINLLASRTFLRIWMTNIHIGS